jgi:hypothetical protein
MIMSVRWLAAAWIDATEGGTGSRAHAENWWAIEKLLDPSRKEPEEAWKVIIAVLERTALSAQVVASLAAGPLDDLLGYHGLMFIGRVEELARSDPDFNLLLGGVWKNKNDR